MKNMYIMCVLSVIHNNNTISFYSVTLDRLKLELQRLQKLLFDGVGVGSQNKHSSVQVSQKCNILSSKKNDKNDSYGSPKVNAHSSTLTYYTKGNVISFAQI